MSAGTASQPIQNPESNLVIGQRYRVSYRRGSGPCLEFTGVFQGLTTTNLGQTAAQFTNVVCNDGQQLSTREIVIFRYNFYNVSNSSPSVNTAVGMGASQGGKRRGLRRRRSTRRRKTSRRRRN